MARFELGTAVKLVTPIHEYEVGASGVVARREHPDGTVLVRFDETNHLVSVEAAALSPVS